MLFVMLVKTQTLNTRYKGKKNIETVDGCEDKNFSVELRKELVRYVSGKEFIGLLNL